MQEEVTFFAVVPSIASAIKLHGDEGMRLTLDVDSSQEEAALAIRGMRGQLLQVTVKVAPSTW